MFSFCTVLKLLHMYKIVCVALVQFQFKLYLALFYRMAFPYYQFSHVQIFNGCNHNSNSMFAGLTSSSSFSSPHTCLQIVMHIRKSVQHVSTRVLVKESNIFNINMIHIYRRLIVLDLQSVMWDSILAQSVFS